jgi:hypothetical protein
MKLFFGLMLTLVLLTLVPLRAQDADRMEHDLDGIAHVASVMIDGDICQRILTARARQHILHPDARDKWSDADNYDVDDQAFITTKKTLIRLAQLADYPVDVNLWMPIEGMPGRIHIVIRNRYEMSQFWTWGTLTQDTPAPMNTVLEKGSRISVRGKSGYISVLAPVRNSLGDIAGLVEVVTRTELDPRENVK